MLLSFNVYLDLIVFPDILEGQPNLFKKSIISFLNLKEASKSMSKSHNMNVLSLENPNAVPPKATTLKFFSIN